MPTIPAAVISNVVAFFTSVYCLRELVIRLGPAHRISQTMRKILFFKFSFEIKKKIEMNLVDASIVGIIAVSLR